MNRLILSLLVLNIFTTYSTEPEKPSSEWSLESSKEKLLQLPKLPGHRVAEYLLARGDLKGFILSQASVPKTDLLESTESVLDSKLSPQGDKLALTFKSKVQLLDLRTQQSLTLQENVPNVSAHFSPDGKKIALYSDNPDTIGLYEVETGAVWKLFEGVGTPAGPVAFSAQGDKLLLIRPGITVVDLKTGEALSLTKDETIVSAALSPAGDKVITGSWTGALTMWDVATGKSSSFGNVQGSVSDVLFSPKGDRIAVNSNMVTLWDTTGNLIQSIPASYYGGANRFSSIAFDREGRYLLLGTNNTKVPVLDGSSGELIRTLDPTLDRDLLAWAFFSQDGNTIITIYPFGARLVKMWDTKTGSLLHTFPGDAAQLSPEGHTLVIPYWTSPNQNVSLYNVETLLSLHEFLDKEISAGQAIALNAIFETIQAQGLVKALGTKAFEEKPTILPEAVRFDFNKHPHLWDDYASLPEALRMIFDPFVVAKRS